MDQAAKAGEPATPSKASALPTWPAGVQLALGFLIIAASFFLLGRWSLDWNRPAPAPIHEFEREVAMLDVNRATRAELRLIPGIGDSLAQRVIDQRERNGPFKSVDDLRQVSGIGPKTLERVRPHLFVAADSFASMEDEESMPAPRNSCQAAAAAHSHDQQEGGRADRANQRQPRRSDRAAKAAGHRPETVAAHPRRACQGPLQIDRRAKLPRPRHWPKDSLDKLRPHVHHWRQLRAVASNAQE